MIEIKNLNVYYENQNKKTQAISNLNARLPRGEICAIIGPSGSGKSTLLKVLAGIIRNYEGEVRIHGKTVDPKIHRIGFVPQNYGLIEWKTVEQNIFLSAKLKDGRKQIDTAFYERILEKLNIKDLIKRYPNQLSGGQRQRVSIARALLLKPDLLLMDEPFSALDALTREAIQEVFLAVWREFQVTTILITHDIREAIYLGKKIAVFSSAPGTIIKMIENPFFGETDLKLGEAYNALNGRLREILKGEPSS